MKQRRSRDTNRIQNCCRCCNRIQKNYKPQIAVTDNAQEDQNNAIADLGSAVSNIADTQTDQGNAIADLGDVVGELADSQEAQDYAIEDLANAVNQIVEPEEGE